MDMIGDLGLAFYPTTTREAIAELDLVDLVHTYSPLLFRVAASIVRSPAEAEDIVQEVFVRVLRHGQKAGGGAPIVDTRVWLVRIAWNLALDRKRRIRPQQMDEVFAASLVSAAQPADRALAESQRMQQVLAEMDKLPAAERHVLLLSAVEELSTPEMARVLARSESAVRALLARARARLRERLAARAKSTAAGYRKETV